MNGDEHGLATEGTEETEGPWKVQTIPVQHFIYRDDTRKYLDKESLQPVSNCGNGWFVSEAEAAMVCAHVNARDGGGCTTKGMKD